MGWSEGLGRWSGRLGLWTPMSQKRDMGHPDSSLRLTRYGLWFPTLAPEKRRKDGARGVHGWFAGNKTHLLRRSRNSERSIA